MSNDNIFRHSNTRNGFTWGPLEVERVAEDEKGGVLVAIKTAHRRMEIRVTPRGRRLFFEFKEPK